MTSIETLALGTLLGLVIKYFWDMLTQGDKKYVSKKDCKACTSHELKDDIVVIKRLMLMVAVKLNIPPEEYNKLIGSREG